MPYRIELGPDGSVNRTLAADELTTVDVQKPHTALADFDAEIPWSRSIRDNVLERCRIYSNGKLLFRGYLKELDWDEARGIVRLNGPGIGDDLKDTAIEVSFTNTASHVAIQQVWDQETNFNATVRQPDVSVIEEDRVVVDADTQAELQAIIDSLPSTAPVTVTSGGRIGTAQSAYVTEGENPPRGFDGGTFTAPGLSDGGAAVVFDPIHDPGWEFTTEYDIPAGDWEVAIMLGSVTSKFWDTFNFNYYGAGFDIQVDGTDVGGVGDSFGFAYQPQDTIVQYHDSAVQDDGGSQTDYTSQMNNATADDVPLLPASPATGDAFYFGFEEAFDTVELDISTPASGTYSITWEYYAKEMNDGGSDFDTSDDTVAAEGWRPIPNVTDNTNGFRQSGTVEWDLADIQDDVQSGGDYTRMSDDGGPNINDVHVRARVTSFTSLSTQPLAQQGWLWGGVKSWLNLGGGSNTLEAGSHTVDLRNIADNEFSSLIDCVVLYDQRFSYNFDETVHQYGGYYDGPQTHPDGYTVHFDQFEPEFNVVGATVTLTGTDDITGDQKVGVSLDGGSTWNDNPNATSVDVDAPSNVGKTLDYRVTFDRYGTRNTATPRTGYQGQSFDAITVDYDASNLSIIQDQTFRGSPFKILQDLHKRSDYRFAIDHAATDGSGNLAKKVESFQRGTITKPKNWTVVNRNPKLSFTKYANEVTVYGGLAGDGTRPKVTVEDTDEVNDVGREPYWEIQPDLNTVDQVRSAAIDLLTSKVGERDQKGTLSTLPTDIQPGYSYPVDWFADRNPTETPLESVSFSEGADTLSGRLQFVTPDDVTGTVIEQGRVIAGTKDAI